MDSERRRPGRREQRARLVPLEVGATEVVLPLLAHHLLALHEVAQPLHVAQAGRRRHEESALLAPIGQVRVEDVLEQSGVLCAEGRGFIELRPEGAANDQLIVDEQDGAAPVPALLGGRGEVELVQVEVHTLWHAHAQACRDARHAKARPGSGHGHRRAERRGEPGELPRGADREARPRGRHKRRGRPAQDCTARYDGSRDAARGGESEAVDAKIDPAIQAVHLRCRIRLEGSVLQTDFREAAIVPQLGDLQAAHAAFGALHADAEPRSPQDRARLDQVLREDGSLRDLAELGDHALALGDEVEVVGEHVGVHHQRVVWPGDGRILKAVVSHNLLSSLNAHLEVGDEDLIPGDVHLRLAHDEPLASTPLGILAVQLRVLEAALHADHRLIVLPEGELLQVIVRLEHDLADARPREPLRLETLELHGGLLRVCGRLPVVDGVQGEQRLLTLCPPHLQRNGQVLQVHGRRRLQRRGHAHRVALNGQASHALGLHSGAQFPSGNGILRNRLGRLPADVELLAPRLLQVLILPLALALVRLHLAEHALGLALSVHQFLVRLPRRVCELPHRQPAALAEQDSLPIQNHSRTALTWSPCRGAILLGHVPRNLHAKNPSITLQNGVIHGRVPQAAASAAEAWKFAFASLPCLI
mmetsp:Transcript_27364/g.77028  ORF Transcript_27364/g.77028 Transcript_27364/m.77028 type:complete len:646 (-) Transcript_27364:157-2094(-)